LPAALAADATEPVVDDGLGASTTSPFGRLPLGSYHFLVAGPADRGDDDPTRILTQARPSPRTRLALRASRTTPSVRLLAAHGLVQLWLYDKPA
jgi:hypothetical protein